MRWTARVRFPAGARDFSFLHSVQTDSEPHPSLLSNGYLGLFPRDKAAMGVKLTTHLRLMQRLMMMELHLHSSILLHGVVIN
jgi:hypothetical protein